MSVKDLIANWEEALSVALSQPDDQDPVTEMHDDALTNVADRRIVRIRSNVRAGSALATLTDVSGKQSRSASLQCINAFIRNQF